MITLSDKMVECILKFEPKQTEMMDILLRGPKTIEEQKIVVGMILLIVSLIDRFKSAETIK